MQGVEAAADEGGESLARVEAVACGEAVTEEDDGSSGVVVGCGVCGRSAGCCRGVGVRRCGAGVVVVMTGG